MTTKAHIVSFIVVGDHGHLYLSIDGKVLDVGYKVEYPGCNEYDNITCFNMAEYKLYLESIGETLELYLTIDILKIGYWYTKHDGEIAYEEPVRDSEVTKKTESNSNEP